MEKKTIAFRVNERDLEQLEIIKEHHKKFGIDRVDTTSLIRYALYYCAREIEEEKN